LIGEGPELNEYKRYISKNKLNVQIIEPQRYLVKFFIESDVCVLPSIRDPFPNFMLQSGLFTKAFIGTDIDGIPELIKNGSNGFLFESGNAKELAEILRNIKNDRAKAAECALSLHKDVMDGFTQDSIIPEIEELYNNLVK
jgi:glycosyltransferase involved in cell wall biosynthesis